MTQPRKEQIKDQRSYFTRIDKIGVTTPVPFGTPDVPGGTVQTIQNTISENYYNEFLLQTVTQTPGGAESDASAFITGAQGPFVSPIVAGASFTITLPNVNSGNSVLITFQPSDVVNIGGSPYITTSKVAARINAALTVAGVNPSSPVAQNVNGQLVLQSAGPSGYTTGSDAFITVNDVTVGVCSTLGLASGNTATITGVTSPVRGIITQSADGFGGFIQLRNPDSSPAITQSSVQIGVGGLGNLPLYPPGQSIYGRLQQVPGISNNPKLVVSYVRQGNTPGKIVTNGGNFSSLTTSDSFTVRVYTINPSLLLNQPDAQVYTMTVTFGTAPTGAQDVINAVNAAWNSTAVSAGFPSGTEAGRGGVIGSLAGPWSFVTGFDQFWIILNGNTPIQIYPTTGLYTAQDLASFINGAISTAGQTVQGSASVSNIGTIQITSNLTSGPSSTVQILAGDLFSNDPYPTNNLTTTLDKLGLVPGVYSGSVVAKPFGNATTVEEIAFVCPDHTVSDPYGTPSSITVSGSASVMAKLGLTGTSVTAATSVGIEPVSPPVVHAMIPEMMEFGEVPENIETTVEQFLATDDPKLAQPGAGTGNLGLSALLAPDGKINPNLIRKIFDVLNIDSLTLGARNLGDLQTNSTPRVVTPFSNSQSAGLTLLWEAASVAGLTGSNAQQIIRLWADSQAGLWFTTNAKWQGPTGTPLQWTKDSPSQSASAIYLGQSTVAGQPKVELLYAGPSVTSPFVFTGSPGDINLPNVALDPSGALNSALAFILAGTTATASNENLIPRFLAQTAANNFTLIWQTQGTAGNPNTRLYSQSTSNTEVDYWLTLNCAWNGVTWQKDALTVPASAIQFQSGGGFGGTLYHWYRGAADDTPWAQWVANGPAGAPGSFLPFSVSAQNGYGGGQVQAGTVRLGELDPPGFTDWFGARISIPIRPGGNGTRILCAEFGTGPQGSDTLLAQGGPGGCTVSATGGGLATITGLTGMTVNMRGQWLFFSGAGNNNNNGYFQIINFISTTSVQIANPNAVAPDSNNGHITWALGGLGNFGQATRIYRSSGFNGSNGYGDGNTDMMMITVNAKWNASQWVPDVGNFPATMIAFTSSLTGQGGQSNAGNGFWQFFTWKPTGVLGWNDDNWLPTVSIGSQGLQVPSIGYDSTNSVGIPNLVNAASTVKAWVQFTYSGNGNTSPTIDVIGSWGCTVSTYLFFGLQPTPLITYNAGLSDANNVVVTNVVGLDVAGASATPATVQYSLGTGSFLVLTSDHNNNVVDYSSTSGGFHPFGWYHLVVFGRQ
jgi:hypothetical protein